MKLLENLLSTPASDPVENENGDFSPKIVTSVTSVPIVRQVEVECPHCEGDTRCNCAWCCEGLPVEVDAECRVCRGTGKVTVWVH